MPAAARGCWQVIWEGMEEQVEASVVGAGTAPAGAGGCPTVFRLHREVWDGGAQGWYHSASCPPCRSVDMPKPAACQHRGDSPGDGTSQTFQYSFDQCLTERHGQTVDGRRRLRPRHKLINDLFRDARHPRCSSQGHQGPLIVFPLGLISLHSCLAHKIQGRLWPDDQRKVMSSAFGELGHPESETAGPLLQ